MDTARVDPPKTGPAAQDTQAPAAPPAPRRGSDSADLKKLPPMGMHRLSRQALLVLLGRVDLASAESIGGRLIEFYEAGGLDPKPDIQDAGSESDDDSAASDGGTSIHFTTAIAKRSATDMAGRRDLDLAVWEGQSVLPRSRVERALSSFFELKDSRSRLFHYLMICILHFDVADRPDEIYAFSSGDAWRLLSLFSEYSFPRQVAKAVLTPELSGQKARPLGGDTYTSTQVFSGMHRSLLGDHMNKVLLLFTSSVRDVDILGLPGYKPKTESKRPRMHGARGHAVDVSLKQVKFRRQFTLPNLLGLVRHVADKVFALGATPEAFRYLDLVQPVSQFMIVGLNRQIGRLVFEAACEGGSLCFDILAGDFKRFQRATEFELSYEKSRHRWDRDADWIYAEDILRELQYLTSIWGWDKDMFARKFSQVQLRYKVGSTWYADRLVRCFQGEVSANQQKFFRVDGRWYEISEDFLRILHTDFRTLLGECLVPDAQRVEYMPDKWTHYPAAKDEKASADDSASDASSVSSESRRKGANDFRFTAYKLRQGMGIPMPRGRAAVPTGTRIINALAAANIIRRVREVKAEKYELVPDVDIDAAVAALGLAKKYKDKLPGFLKPYVKDFRNHAALRKNRDEYYYNLGYAQKSQYVLGDCRTPDGLELFDVLWHSPDKKTLRLFHNKKGFANHVRDVCSQMVNAAEGIVSMRNSTQRGALNRLHAEIVKLGFCSMTQRQFQELILRPDLKNIEFVFGFMEDAKSDRTLYEELTRPMGTKTKFGSNIARMDLIRARDRLKALGVTLRIVPIYPDDELGTQDGLIELLTQSQSMGSLGFDEEDSAALADPLFERAWGNDCWLTPFLMSLRYSAQSTALLASINPQALHANLRRAYEIIQSFCAGNSLSTAVMQELRGLLLQTTCIPVTAAQRLQLVAGTMSQSNQKSLLTRQYDPQNVLVNFWDKCNVGAARTLRRSVENLLLPQGVPTENEDGFSDPSDPDTPSQGHFDAIASVLRVRRTDPPTAPIFTVPADQADLSAFVQGQFRLEEDFEGVERTVRPYEYEDPVSHAVMCGDFELDKKIETQALGGDFFWVDFETYTSDLPETMDLAFAPGDIRRFKLSAVIEHVGNRGGGHYYSYHELAGRWEKYEYGRQIENYNDVGSFQARVELRMALALSRFKVKYERV